MTGWQPVFSRQVQKDAKKLAASGLKPRAQLLGVIAEDPFATPPRFEKLVGVLAGCYSRRINIQYRLVYEVLPTPAQSTSSACGPTTNESPSSC